MSEALFNGKHSYREKNYTKRVEPCGIPVLLDLKYTQCQCIALSRNLGFKNR